MHAELLYMWTCSKASLFVIESTVERKHDDDFVVAVGIIAKRAVFVDVHAGAWYGVLW